MPRKSPTTPPGFLFGPFRPTNMHMLLARRQSIHTMHTILERQRVRSRHVTPPPPPMIDPKEAHAAGSSAMHTYDTHHSIRTHTPPHAHYTHRRMHTTRTPPTHVRSAAAEGAYETLTHTAKTSACCLLKKRKLAR
jgi:hypothetical protein